MGELRADRTVRTYRTGWLYAITHVTRKSYTVYPTGRLTIYSPRVLHVALV